MFYIKPRQRTDMERTLFPFPKPWLNKNTIFLTLSQYKANTLLQYCLCYTNIGLKYVCFSSIYMKMLKFCSICDISQSVSVTCLKYNSMVRACTVKGRFVENLKIVKYRKFDFRLIFFTETFR